MVPLSDAKHKPQRLQNLRAAAWLSLKTSAVEINEQYFSLFKKISLITLWSKPTWMENHNYKHILSMDPVTAVGRVF